MDTQKYVLDASAATWANVLCQFGCCLKWHDLRLHCRKPVRLREREPSRCEGWFLFSYIRLSFTISTGDTLSLLCFIHSCWDAGIACAMCIVYIQCTAIACYFCVKTKANQYSYLFFCCLFVSVVIPKFICWLQRLWTLLLRACMQNNHCNHIFFVVLFSLFAFLFLVCLHHSVEWSSCVQFNISYDNVASDVARARTHTAAVTRQMANKRQIQRTPDAINKNTNYAEIFYAAVEF